jgi:ABC-type transport system involved in multi-copper enzyme maturation permease subunit
MTVREKGYTHWDGELKPARHPWWPIARLGIKLAFKKKYFKFIYFSAFIPAFAFLVGIYISERIEDFQWMVRGSTRILEMNPRFFNYYFSSDFLLFMMVMILLASGAGLISDDLKYNSLQLYLARPLRKKDYLAGKAAVLVFFIFSLTILPGLVVIVFKLLFAGNFSFLSSYPWLPLAVIGHSLLVTVFFCLYTLLLSSLSKNRRYVSILIFGVYVFSDILHGFFSENFKQPAFALVSLKANLQQMGAFFFKQKPVFPVAWHFSLFILVSLCLLAAVVLSRKVKGVEVVK